MQPDRRFAPTTLGERVRERDFGWFGITEAVHRPGTFLRPHAHRYPAITMVRRGGFGLEIGRDTIACTDHGVFFKRGEHAHANAVGREGSRSLILEVRTDSERVERRGLPLPSESFWTGDRDVMRLAAGIEREFEGADVASRLAVEGLALELVAALLRRPLAAPDASPPAWLAAIDEMLSARSREPLGLAGVAAAVGRHPVHVARTFRRHRGCSLGEYVRRVRIERAARCLRDTDLPLSEVALEAGFYDQAHFCRAFKAWASVTPGAYRRSFRG